MGARRSSRGGDLPPNRRERFTFRSRLGTTVRFKSPSGTIDRSNALEHVSCSSPEHSPLCTSLPSHQSHPLSMANGRWRRHSFTLKQPTMAPDMCRMSASSSGMALGLRSRARIDTRSQLVRRPLPTCPARDGPRLESSFLTQNLRYVSSPLWTLESVPTTRAGHVAFPEHSLSSSSLDNRLDHSQTPTRILNRRRRVSRAWRSTRPWATGTAGSR